MSRGDVLVRMKADTSSYNAGIASANKTLAQFKQANLTMGGIINQTTKSIVAAAAQYASFAAVLGTVASGFAEAVSTGSAMAREMEGVKAAFSRLNRPNLLNNLREATHGTVNDLELMKQAVKFGNFNLSLEQMGTFLAFAQQQAKDTGQDVGYLVDSIVTGLGRKSLPILDNLGLSATEIRERMKETGDMTKAVASIIQDRMNAAGGYVETAADRAARATTDMQNAMMELGKVFAPLTESAHTFFSAVQIDAIKSLTYIGKLMNTLSGSGRSANVALGEDANIQKGLGKLKVAKAAGSDYMVRSLYNDQVESYNRRINDYDAQIKNGGRRPGAGSGESRDIRWLQAQRDGLVIARDQYIQQAKQIMTPIVKNTTVDTGGTVGGGKTDKAVETTIDDILAKQWETASQKMATMADSLRGEDTGPSDAWKMITTNADKATDSISSLAKAFGELNKVEGLPENGTGEPENVGKNTKSMAKEMEKFVGISTGMLGGINNIVGGLQGLGVEIPKELQGVIGGIQGLMSIVTGIAAILSIIQTLQAIQTTESTIKSVPVVGWLLAQGGVVHAASGYEVPGNYYSGDQVPALLNSGELVLNKAQQGNLASQLQGNGLQNMNIAGRIKGTDIILSIDRSLKLEGKQLLTWGR